MNITLRNDDQTIKLTTSETNITFQEVGRRGLKGDPGDGADAPVLSVNNKLGAVVLNKSDIGLSNVDNTSDLNKPVSTATQAVLSLKASTSSLAAVAISGEYDDLLGKPTKYVYNVMDYGANGNGTGDDTAAVNNAITAANGGDVYAPSGTYIIDPDVSINLTAGTYLHGDGRKTIFKVADNSDVLDNLIKVENADGVFLENFAIDGNRANQDASDAVAVHYGVYVASSDNVRVENVTVHSTTGVGIHVYDSVGTVVSHCESSDNRYHGFEFEQVRNCILDGGNRGHNNLRHGLFISPGEVGGTGAIGNVIAGNSFDNNANYGIAFGIDAGGLSIGLTRENAIVGNTVTHNGEYGMSVYRVDDTLISNNLVAYNGRFGIYLYRAERNKVTENRLRNNSQTANGAYDEILLEGAGDGQASQHNKISDNYIYIDGTNKANYAIREASSNDGPNVIEDNYIPNAGVSGRTLIQHVNTRYSLISDTPAGNTNSLRTFEKGLIVSPGATLPGGVMGFDAPFDDAVFRMFSDLGNLQYVAPNGNADWYLGGNNVFSVTSTYASLHGYPLKEVDDPVDIQDAATKNYVDSRVGVTVQAYDTDLTTWAGKTAPAGTAVGTTDTQTLTNKTLTSPAINGGAIAASTLSVLGNSTTGSGITLYEDTDNGTDSVFLRAPVSMGGNKTIILPLPTTLDTLVGEATTATITNKTLDNTNTVTLKRNLFTLQDNTDTTKQVQFNLSEVATGTTRQIGLPDLSTTLVGRSTVDTLTNKTLTSPRITSGSVPATATSTGTAGQVQWDADYIYVCTAANTWKRSPLTTW